MSTSSMGQRLSGKTILITGATSGIGRSTALEFARTSKNLKLVIAARRFDLLEELARTIQAEVGDGVKVHPAKLDVSSRDQVQNFVENLPSSFREIDVLINNAGLVRGVDEVGDIKAEDLDVMFSTNVVGLINMTQAILPIFKKRPDGGHGDVVNVGSIAGRDHYQKGSVYCASKAAVTAFTNAMRKELINTKIRVMEIAPGQVETEFSIVRFYGDKAKADAVYQDCEPLTALDIAESIIFNVGRRENVVIADTLIFPNHQAGATAVHKNKNS